MSTLKALYGKGCACASTTHASDAGIPSASRGLRGQFQGRHLLFQNRLRIVATPWHRGNPSEYDTGLADTPLDETEANRHAHQGKIPCRTLTRLEIGPLPAC